MKRKPYTARRGEKLLARLVSFAEAPTIASGRHAAARRMLADVLRDGPRFTQLSDARHELLGDAEHEIPIWPITQLSAFQHELRAFVRSLVQKGKGGRLLPTVSMEQLEIAIAPAGSQVVLAIDGPTRTVLWFQVISLLDDVGLSRVCACPGCERLFVRSGKRAYCSERCQSRVYMRKWRREIQPETLRRELRRATARR